jgi:hypothetical protein
MHHAYAEREALFADVMADRQDLDRGGRRSRNSVSGSPAWPRNAANSPAGWPTGTA